MGLFSQQTMVLGIWVPREMDPRDEIFFPQQAEIRGLCDWSAIRNKGVLSCHIGKRIELTYWKMYCLLDFVISFIYL